MNDSFQPESAAFGESASVLTDIYDENKNIAIWSRSLPDSLQKYFAEALEDKAQVSVAQEVSVNSMASDIDYALRNFPTNPAFNQHVEELVDMFSCLFDLPRVGMRIRTLEKAMCPKFHVDRVPCRMVTTFAGSGTQWLPHETVNREDFSLDQAEKLLRNLNSGDVGLLKGELWEGNENRGLVHRSPAVPPNEPKRLLLTLDFL